MPSFTVTAAGHKVELDASGAGRASFTVTNTSAQALKGRLLTEPSGPAKPEWFSIVGESVRDFATTAGEEVVVQLAVPPGSPPGAYSFRLDAVSQTDPDEDFTQGPSVAFEVAPPPPKKPFPWWIVAVAGGVVLLIIIGVVVFLLVRGSGGSTGTVVSSGNGTIPGTFLFDLDSGAVTQAGADLFWEQVTSVQRKMAPQGGATLVNLGVRDFDSLGAKALSKLNYSSAPIPANDDQTNQLVNGDVFAVHSSDGNFAKVKVISYGRDLGVQWVTFRPGG